MASRTYVGVSASAVAHPGALYRLAFRHVFSFGDLGKEILSVGFTDTGLDDFSKVAQRFIENLPGSGVAIPLPPPIIDAKAGVAVVDVKLASSLPFGATIAEVMNAIEAIFSGAELFRVSAVGAENLTTKLEGRENELEGAVTADARLDASPWDSLIESVKAGGFTILLLILVAFAAYLAVKGGALRKELPA